MMLLSPGTTEVWSHCPAAAASVDDDKFHRLLTDTARESMAIRWAVESLLEGNASEPEELVGRVTRGGGEVTEDIARHAWEFITAVTSANGRLSTVESVRLVCAGDPNQRGVTIGPVKIIHAPGPILFVLNYAWKSKQDAESIFLGIAAMAQLDERAGRGADEVRIFEPRANWRQKWTLVRPTLADIVEVVERIATAAMEAASGNPRARVGWWCSYCAHRGDCSALEAAVRDEYQRPPSTLGGIAASTPALCAELEYAETMLKVASARVDALRAETKARAFAGEWMPGWRLNRPDGRRELSVPLRDATAVLGIEAGKTVAKTPAELEREGADPAVLATITRKPTGAPRLEAITEKDIKRSFND